MDALTEDEFKMVHAALTFYKDELRRRQMSRPGVDVGMDDLLTAKEKLWRLPMVDAERGRVIH